ncbi:MAG: Mu-like prophage major head subunit gpT family protein [Methylobacter sp.]
MDSNLLSSRAVIGMYYQQLELSQALGWLDAISNYFTSDQPEETYAMLGMPPVLREWIGGRQAKGLRDDSFKIINRHFEATIEFLIKDMRRDKTGQIRARITEFVERGNSHFAKLLSLLILNGASSVCYDGQYFFDTDHSEGDSGAQSNSITVDISGLPATVHGTTTAPSPEELQQAILTSITQMMGFVDDQGEPINENASEFLIMLPVGLSMAAQSALTMARAAAASTFAVENLKIRAAINPRLSSWTDKFVAFRADGSIKPLIRQEETKPQLKVKDETSEYAFDNDTVQFGIDTWRNTGYGRWQGAVLAQLV